jgi:drug/metabolite transporter (DMT)-like permease
MLTATIVLWALNLTASRYVLTHGFRPLAFSGVRYTAAAAISAAVTLALEGSLRIARRDLGLFAIAVGTLFLNQIGFVYSLKLTTATTVALVLGATPIFAALMGLLVGYERVSKRFAVAAVISFAGVGLVASGSGGALSGNLGGDLFALLTAATWAMYSIAVARLMERYSPLRISSLILAGCSVPLLAVGAPQVIAQDYGRPTTFVWLVVAYTTIGPLVVTNLLWYRAVLHVGPSRATLFTNLQPFIAALFAVLLLSETIAGLQIAGGVLVAVGIGLGQVRRARVPLQPE